MRILLILKTIEHSDPKLEQQHLVSIQTVESILKKQGVPFDRVLRAERQKIKDWSRYSLLITVGGDGTFLDASHDLVTETPLLGVNSNPQSSHGALCSTTCETFEVKLCQILEKRLSPQARIRIGITLNQKLMPCFALNDVLFAHICPAGTSRYQIVLEEESENQKSSGIWVATPAGSTGAIHSAGGRVLDPNDPKLEFLVREPFAHQRSHYKILQGYLASHQKLKLRPQMLQSAVFVDGAHLSYPLFKGDEVEIGVAPKPLWTF